MFIILFSLSLALAWEYHDAGVLPFLLGLYAVLRGNLWNQFREAASALFRMRVPVIAGLLAFAIYTNDQILEVLAMPYQVWPPRGEAIPLLSLAGIGVALWFWARFFSWFGPQAPAWRSTPLQPEDSHPLRQALVIVAVLAIVIAAHAGIFHVFSAVIDKEVPFTDRTAARHIAMAIVSVSFLSWLYFTCIFNRHLPFENNLPDALAARPYNLQVRIVLLRLLPIALPCLLAAAMIHNVLPRIDPRLEQRQAALGPRHVQCVCRDGRRGFRCRRPMREGALQAKACAPPQASGHKKRPRKHWFRSGRRLLPGNPKLRAPPDRACDEIEACLG